MKKCFKKISRWNSCLESSMSLRYFWQLVIENPALGGRPTQGKPPFHLSCIPEQFYDWESGMFILSTVPRFSPSSVLCCPHSTRELHYGSKTAAGVLRVKATLWCPEAHSGALSNHVCLLIDGTDCQKPLGGFSHPLLPELLPVPMSRRERKRAMAVDLE